MASNAIEMEIELADMDMDGSMDLVVLLSESLAPSPHSVRVFLNDGDALFTPVSTQELPARIRRLRVDDLDRDGILDVVASSEAPGTSFETSVTVLVGVGDGQLGAPQSHDSPIVGEMSLHDVDLDGVLDVVLGGGGLVAVFRGVGDGGLEPDQLYSGGGPGLLVGDLDGDGMPDVMVGLSSFSPSRLVPSQLLE